jgi:sulfite reductase (NADPH) flavoprotein alpha-component
LSYAVLGLGDSSYPLFCAIGRQLDARLAELGARRLFAAGEADIDIETVAAPWRSQALAAARESIKVTPSLASVTPLRPSVIASAWSRERPFAAEVFANQRITARDSAKDVRHIELSLAGSGLSYAAGDALGVWHRNPPALVAAVLESLGLNGDVAVAQRGETLPLREWLSARRELTRLSRPVLAAQAERSGVEELAHVLAPEQSKAFAAPLDEHQLIDVLRRWPARWDPESLVAALRPLTPRLYSIASSPAAVGEEAHLTVDVLGYDAFGQRHVGAASSHLAALADGDTAAVFIEPNERFRVPADGSRDLIMIGPGTGVAPFRAFLQERVAAGATGRHWLFFGNPHFRSDFL